MGGYLREKKQMKIAFDDVTTASLILDLTGNKCVGDIKTQNFVT